MRKVLKVAAAFLLLSFAGVQFDRPERVNPPAAAGQSLEEHARVPEEVAGVLKRSCMDCHSNRTDWPWYSNVAPVSWFVTDHVKQGRRYLNFSRWDAYSRRDQIDHLNAICAEVKSGSMPLDSYTLIHRSARLAPADVRTLCAWAGEEQMRIAATD